MKTELKKYAKPTLELVDVEWNRMIAGSGGQIIESGVDDKKYRGWVYVPEATESCDGGWGGYKRRR